MTGRLGKRYARAVLGLARSAGALEATGEELARAAAVFDEPRLRPFLLSPAIDRSTRQRTAKAVVATLGVSKIVANTINLLADRHRLAVLPDVARWFDHLLDDDLGRARVTLRSAAPLSVAEKNDLIAVARRLTGRENVLATTTVDAELLGGVVLDVAGTVYDGSVKAQLARLSKDMAGGTT